MLNNIKQNLLPFFIYFGIGFILYDAGITVMSWHYWAVFALLIVFHVGISVIVFEQNFRKYQNAVEFLNDNLKNFKDSSMPPSSAPSAPANTSQRDATPPQS